MGDSVKYIEELENFCINYELRNRIHQMNIYSKVSCLQNPESNLIFQQQTQVIGPSQRKIVENSLQNTLGGRWVMCVI